MAVIAAAATLGRRATTNCNPFLSSISSILNNKRWTSSNISCNPNNNDANVDLLNDTLVLKEDFEVGSRLYSFKTGEMDLSSYVVSDFKVQGVRIRDESLTGRVVMDVEETSKVSAVVKVGENMFKTKSFEPKFPEVHVSYNEYPFLDAQKAILDAQQKVFPSHTLMMRPLFNNMEETFIRPLFPAGYYRHDVVATIDVLKSEGEHDPVIMAANATSAALMLSGIAWGGPIGVVRIGRIWGSDGGRFVVNPTMNQVSGSHDLNLVYACTQDKTLMIELQAGEISNRDLEEALRLAHHEAVKYIEAQIRLAERAGIHKDHRLVHSRTVAVENKVKSLAKKQIEAAISTSSNNENNKNFFGDKFKRKEVLNGITQYVEERVREEYCSDMDVSLNRLVRKAVRSVMENVIRSRIIEKGLRVDGRRLDEVRTPLYCESGTLPIRYGSSLFWLGNTQVLCSVELRNANKSYHGSDDDDDDDCGYEDLIFKYSRRPGFNMRYDDWQNANNAFLAVLPPEDDFPYHVYVGVDVMASGHDGSSTNYTATVCGGSLALMDAGIPLKRHVAGVSMGLVSEVDPSTGMIKNYGVLTDLDGHDLELVDMHLKIAGTRKGVTEIILDIKNRPADVIGAGIQIGIPLDIICGCFEPALKARLQILDHMEREIDAPRRSTPSFIQNGCNWRTLDDLSISYCNPRHKGRYSMDSLGSLQLIGPAAADDQALHAKKKNQAVPRSKAGKAQKRVVDHLFVKCGFKVGGIYEGVIFSIRVEDGAFVEFYGSSCIGFLHISELLHGDAELKISPVSIGQRLSVMCIGYDTRGFLKLSPKTKVPQNEDEKIAV